MKYLLKITGKILVVLFLGSHSGCLNRGTDEASLFIPKDTGELLPADAVVTFEFLKERLLRPNQCLECHSEFNNEAQILNYIVRGNPEASKIFQEVSTGAMPPAPREKVSDPLIDILRRYIVGLNTVVTPEPVEVDPVEVPPVEPPAPILEATYTSLSVHLVKKSCFDCHNAVVTKGKIDLSTYELFSKNALEALKYIENDEMPPPKRRGEYPVPSAEVISVFKEWIQKGNPQ